MKKSFHVFLMTLLVLLLFFIGSFSFGATAKTPAAGTPKYGGTVTLANVINPMAWDIAEWAWKLGQDTGFYGEHLMMGDLQKGPRGTRQYGFHTLG